MNQKKHSFLLFLVLFLSIFSTMMPGVSADNVPTVVTLPATGIGATNATLWSNITNTGGSDIISYGFEYGTTTSYGNMVSSKAEYIYAGGFTTQTVRQYWMSNLTKKAETEDYGGDINAIVVDDTYVYAGGCLDTNTIRQYWKSNLTMKQESENYSGYGGMILALAVDDIYIYAGGFYVNTVCQYWKSNLTMKQESESYGSTIVTLAIDDTYIYAGGDGNSTVRQYWKSNLTMKQESVKRDHIRDLVVDGTYVYACGYGQTVRQYWKSNLTMKQESESYGDTIQALAIDDTYVYAGGYGNNTVRQYWKSNLTMKQESESYGDTIQALAIDDTYVYAAGYSQTVCQYWKSNMTYRAETSSYGGIIKAICIDYGVYAPFEFSYPISDLSPGTLYHYRAFANNSDGTGYGDDMNFLTKPNAPSNFVITREGSGFNLSWTKGNGANNTLVRGKIGSYPTSISDGDLIYNNTGNYVFVTGQNPGETWYYRCWSHTVWSDLYQWSDSYAQGNKLFVVNATVTTNAASGVGATNATLWGNITDTGGAPSTVGFQYGLSNTTLNTSVKVASTDNYSSDFITGWNYRIFPEYIITLNNSMNTTNTVANLVYLQNGGTSPVNIDVVYWWDGGAWKSYVYFLDSWLGSLGALPVYPGEEYKFQAVQNFTFFINYDLGGIPIPFEYSYNVSSLTPGTLYHYRAFANNSNGTGYGDDMNFTTIVPPPTNLKATRINDTSISLSWTKGSYGTTVIRRNIGSYPNLTIGDEIYNDTGNSYVDTGLNPSTHYFYRAWMFYNIYSEDNTSSSNWTSPSPPTNVDAISYGGAPLYLNISWVNGVGSDRTVIRRSTSSQPVYPSDGENHYNDTGIYCNETLSTPYYFTVFAYNSTTNLYSVGVNVSWYVGYVWVKDYDTGNNINGFNLFFTDSSGDNTYRAINCNTPHLIGTSSIPTGSITVIIEKTGYVSNSFNIVITDTTTFNRTFFITPESYESEGDCSLQSFINSISISNPAVDATITHTHDLESMISVEIYNSSLYGSYGGWLFISEDKYSYNTTHTVINESILDANTSMARVTYYYMYCPDKTVSIPLYYIRVVETIETEYTQVDKGVENALVTISTYVNSIGSYQVVSSTFTDANGYINVYLKSGVLYKINISKTGYDTKISDYIPAPANQWGQTTEKIFRIIRNQTLPDPGETDYLFKNIIWSIQPTGLRHKGSFTVWFNITSTDNKLEWYSMQIFYYNTTNYTWVSIFYQNDSNPGGGSISFTIPNVTGKYAIKCFFKKTGYPAQELGETGSLIHFIEHFRDWVQGIPFYAYYIVLLFIMIVTMGFFFIYFGTGLSTGYIGLIIMGIGLWIYDSASDLPMEIDIGDMGISAWIIFGITFLMYSIGVFIWSRI